MAAITDEKESAEQISKRLGADLSLLAGQMGADLGDPKVAHTLFLAVMAKSIALSTSRATNLLSQIAKDGEQRDNNTRTNLGDAAKKLRDSSHQIVADVQRAINHQFAAKERTSWALIIAAVAASIIAVGWTAYLVGYESAYKFRGAEMAIALNRCGGGQIVSDANGTRYCQWKFQ